MAASARRALLTAALGFLEIHWLGEPPVPVQTLARWMNTWTRLGAVVAGMPAQGFDVELRQFPDGWRANSYVTGVAHSGGLRAVGRHRLAAWSTKF